MVVANTDFPVIILSEVGAKGNLVGAVRRCAILLDVETCFNTIDHNSRVEDTDVLALSGRDIVIALLSPKWTFR